MGTGVWGPQGSASSLFLSRCVSCEDQLRGKPRASEGAGPSPAFEFAAGGGWWGWQTLPCACPLASQSRVAGATLGGRKSSIRALEGSFFPPPSFLESLPCPVCQPRLCSQPSEAVTTVKAGFVTLRQ